MNNKRLVLGITRILITLIVVLSAWALFLPNGIHGMMGFGTVFPVWLIVFAVLVLALVLLVIIEEG